MSAFSDIAFLLIIFFILTTTLEQFTGKLIDVPAGKEGKTEEKKQLTLTVTDRTVYYGDKGKQMDIKQLREALSKERFAEKNEQDRVVIVDAGDTVPYEIYFQIVTAISNADGILAFIEKPEGGKGGQPPPSSSGGEGQAPSSPAPAPAANAPAPSDGGLE